MQKSVVVRAVFSPLISIVFLSPAASGKEFRAVGGYDVGKHPVSLTAGDFNRDGHLDLAVANSGSKTISVLLGNGDGTFQASVNYEVDTEPWSILVMNVDGDGTPDLAVGDYRNDSASVLLGKGDGTFDLRVNSESSAESQMIVTLLKVLEGKRHQTGAHRMSVALGDFNGDGALDEAMVSSVWDRVSVLLGNNTASGGQFEDQLDLPSGSVNLLQNSGLEAGTLPPWFLGRKNCNPPCKDWAVLHSLPRFGRFDAGDLGNLELRQDFVATDTSSITRVSLWIRHPSGVAETAIDFFYTDGTDQEFIVSTTDANWTFFDVTAELLPQKFLKGFSVWGFDGVGTDQTFLDNAVVGKTLDSERVW
jgi:hypothetical protein